MATFLPTFTYLEQYQILICDYHRSHGALSDLSRHLHKEHNLSLSAHRDILDKHCQLSLRSPKTIQNPPSGGRPLVCLGSPDTGFQCAHKDCGVISTNSDRIRKHANQHGWRANKQEPMYWQEVKVQTFFKRHDLVKYFIVQAEDEEEVDNEITNFEPRPPPSRQYSNEIISNSITLNHNLTVEQQVEVNAVAQEWSNIQEQHEQKMQEVEAEQAAHDRTGWWSFTKWADHFRSCNMRYLFHASRVPDQDELLLREASRVVDLTLNRALTGLATLHRETRRWLRSPKLTEPDNRPLARLQQANSQERYHNYWRRFICYCFRVWLSQQEVGTTERESRPPRNSRPPTRALSNSGGEYATSVADSTPQPGLAVTTLSSND